MRTENFESSSSVGAGIFPPSVADAAELEAHSLVVPKFVL